MTTDSAAEVLTYDPYDYAIQDDPYPVYAWLRDNAPLYHNEEHGFWALSRHADVVAAFRNEAVFSNRMGVSLDPASWGPHAKYVDVVPRDGPARADPAAGSWSPVGSRRAGCRTGAADPRARLRVSRDRGADAGSFDFVDEFAGKLPMDVISETDGRTRAGPCRAAAARRLVVAPQPDMRDVPQEGLDAALRCSATSAT